MERLVDEFLTENRFMKLKHAPYIIEEWRRDFNQVRPHSSLNGRGFMKYPETASGLMPGEGQVQCEAEQ